jgi:hypothetical protein
MLPDSNTAAPQSAPPRCWPLAGACRPALAAGILLILCAQSATQTCLGADVALEEVRAGYVQTVTSMPRIWTRCLSKKTVPEEMARLMAKGSSRSADSFSFDGAIVEWATDGLKSHYRFHGGARPDGSPLKPNWFSCDGTRVWTLEYSKPEERGELQYAKHQSLTTRTDSALRIEDTPGKWLGLYFGISEQQQSGASLVTLLQSGDPRLVGPEEIDGHLCYRVEMLFPSARPGDTLPVTAWFDPQVGYLPRRISNDFNGSSPPSDYRVLSFREVAVNNTGQTVWFPERMMIERKASNNRIVSTDDLTLLEVRINEPLAGDLFRPKVPAGIPVFDLDRESEVQRLLAFRSKPAREKAMAEARAARANRATPTPQPAALASGITAQASTGPGWPAILMATGLLMLIVSTIWAYRRPRDS